MGKRKSSKRTEEKYTLRYPIGLVFNVSTLATSISVLIQLAAGDNDIYRILLRAMLIFLGFSVAGSIVMVTVVAVLHAIKQQELQEKQRLAEEEQMAALLSTFPSGHLRSSTPPTQQAPPPIEQSVQQ
ncbi:MAG: hypothetical protein RML15_01975 [Bacteroidota bacterium]|nr:hypothetical protein [Candidatus Kapabacteria bacterium]MCS7302470.1 hypothetical protein [Candidatus Kapabacteria bacterium]MDW8074359.1 hypothetical protein [Bacteroidota bacterium]MDW8271165.1 hypothetical protein [Bacteroidota bacterium]